MMHSAIINKVFMPAVCILGLVYPLRATGSSASLDHLFESSQMETIQLKNVTVRLVDPIQVTELHTAGIPSRPMTRAMNGTGFLYCQSRLSDHITTPQSKRL